MTARLGAEAWQGVGAADVSFVALSGPSGGIVNSTVTIRAAAESSGEVVHGPQCVWTLDAGGDPVTIDSIGEGTILLTASGPGSATITCDIGSASDSMSVTFV